MVTDKQRAKAEKFLSLHMDQELLVMPNVWNPIGARILEAKGYPAVATASSSIAESLGYMDGEKIKRETLLEVLGRISNSVDVPVTADIETGYGDSLDSLQETISKVITTGVVGINIEDSLVEGGPLRTVEEQCQRIAAVRERADALGLHLFINARVDSFVSAAFDSNKERIEEAIVRSKKYVEAGADGIYPMGAGEWKTLLRLRREINAPLNVLASPSTVGLNTLRQLGINRVTLGPYLFRSCYAKFASIADKLLEYGEYDCFAEEMLTSGEIRPYLRSGRED